MQPPRGLPLLRCAVVCTGLWSLHWVRLRAAVGAPHCQHCPDVMQYVVVSAPPSDAKIRGKITFNTNIKTC